MQVKIDWALRPLVWVFCAVTSFAQITYFVDEDDGSDLLGTGTGGWVDALATIEEALNRATQNDIILVAEGKYGPEVNASGTSVKLRDDIDIFGGFFGYPSGSTDPANPDGRISKTVIKGTPLPNPSRACQAIGTDNAKLRGFVIRGGRAVEAGADSGGGIYCLQTADLAIELVRFHNNEASVSGGGAFLGSPARLVG